MRGGDFEGVAENATVKGRNWGKVMCVWALTELVPFCCALFLADTCGELVN